VAAYGKLTVGHDPDYYVRQMAGELAKTGASYYADAVLEKGEPEGTWIGEGLASLSIHDGDRVDHDVFLSLYDKFKDPATGEYLGSPPRVNAQLQALFEQKKAAEPGLTRAREHELWMEARAEVRSTGVMFYDGAFNVDKTISAAYASALVMAKHAREAGDEAAAARHGAAADAFWEEIMAGVRTTIAHIQREAGYVRTGHHGGKGPDGEPTGRRERAYDIPVAIFPQFTNRDGEIHLHVHITFLNKVLTISDGKWRAPDARLMFRNYGSAIAAGALAMESGITRRLGFSWKFRPESKGRVIAEVPEAVIPAFSTRGAKVKALKDQLVAQFEEKYGRAPARDELFSLGRHAWKETRKPKPEGALDLTAKLSEWEAATREAQLGSLLDIGRKLFGHAGSGAAYTELSPAQECAVMAEGLALAQNAKAAWGKRDLVHWLAFALPDGFVLPAGADADTFLSSLADRVIAGESGEPVVCLSAPEYPRVPEALRRECDGESVYRAHGSDLYATAGQMSLEARVVAMAHAPGAPRIAPDVCAKLLGADEAALEAQLRAAAGSGSGAGSVTGSGLRLDQGSVAFHALTSPRRTEVVAAPAGAGKTHTAGVMSTAWQAAGMGRVFGVAISAAARNELAGAGVPNTYTLAKFLGHTEEAREALPKVAIGPGDMVLVDEGTTMDLHNFDALQRYVAARGAVIRMFAGDQQLGAVEGIGAAGLLCRSGKYARLAEPVRFAPGWERDASLALHDGDVACLTEYENHGRLHGGTYEEMAEQAARLYMADLAEDVETSLNAHSHFEVADLNKRVQAYMDEYGLARGRAVRLRADATARPGELVLARRNDNKTEADRGRKVSNGDVLEIREVTGDKVTVRRLTGHDKQTGRRTWSAPYALTTRYLREHGELGYAQTTATTQGDTTWSGIHLSSDQRPLQTLYPGMTRGRHRNHVFAYPAEPDCEPGKEPEGAPEVGRQRAIEAERDGPMRPLAESEHDPVVLLAKVVRRADVELGATETREKLLADADHTGTLWQIRQDVVRQVTAPRYEAAVREHLSEEHATEVLADTDDLWRALRGAQLKGADPARVLAAAVAQRGLDDAESVPAVLTHRVRQLTEDLPPLAARLQPAADAEMTDFLDRTDAALDARRERLGEHMANHPPAWALRALGVVPGDDAGRQAWADLAGGFEGYREARNFESDETPIGPCPPTTEPEMRAWWLDLDQALGTAEESRARGLTEGQLRVRRTGGLRDTTWAPPEVAREMGVAHGTETGYRLAAAHHLLHARKAQKAAREDRAVMHRAAAREAQAAAERCREVAAGLAEAHATRQQYNALHGPGWAEATEADRELRRRGLLSPDDVLRSQERPAFDYAGLRARQEEARRQADAREPEASGWVQDVLALHDSAPAAGTEPAPDAAAHRPRKPEPAYPAADEVKVMLGIDPAHVLEGGTGVLEQVKADAAAAQEKIDREGSILEPDAGDEDLSPSQAWSLETGRDRHSILHDPAPEMPIAPEIAAAVAERDREAAD